MNWGWGFQGWGSPRKAGSCSLYTEQLRAQFWTLLMSSDANAAPVAIFLPMYKVTMLITGLYGEQTGNAHQNNTQFQPVLSGCWWLLVGSHECVCSKGNRMANL